MWNRCNEFEVDGQIHLLSPPLRKKIATDMHIYADLRHTELVVSSAGHFLLPPQYRLLPSLLRLLLHRTNSHTLQTRGAAFEMRQATKSSCWKIYCEGQSSQGVRYALA